MKQWLNDRLAQASVFLRERKERAAERKAQAAGAPAMEYGFDRTPRRIRFAVLLATIAVIGFLLLWVTQITGVLQLDLAVDWALDRPFALDWDLRMDLNVLPLIVLGLVSFGIVFWSKAWVSLFAQTPWHEWFSKWGALVLGIGGSLAIIMGGFEVNQNTREEDFRGALVQQQSAEQGRAQIQAQITSIDQRLASMRDQARVGVYAAIAASVGASAYDSDYLSADAMARTPPDRRDIVRRARGAAVAADALEAQRLQLAGQLAAAAPEAATAAHVEMSDPVSQFIGGIGAWRIVILVLVGDLILLFGNYFADKAEERVRYAHSTQASGWADEAHRIEDKTAEDRITPQPMKPPREVVRDAETGEELIKITPKPHWRKRKGKVEQLETQRDSMDVEYEGRTFTTRGADVDDSSQAIDTSGREAVSVQESDPGLATSPDAAGDAENDHRHEQQAESEDAQPVEEVASAHSEPPSQDYLDALSEALPSEDVTPEQPVEQPTDQDDSDETDDNAQSDDRYEGDDIDHREPETRPERLIAAE